MKAMKIWQILPAAIFVQYNLLTAYLASLKIWEEVFKRDSK